MGVHTGEPHVGEEGYLGLDVVRAARISAAGHGGQILISDTTRALLGNQLPEGVAVHDLGQQDPKRDRRGRLSGSSRRASRAGGSRSTRRARTPRR